MFSSSNTQNQILVKCMFWDLPCIRHIHSEGGREILYRAPLSLLGSLTMLCSCKNNKKQKIMMLTLRKIAYKIINRSIKFTRLDFWSDINHPVGSVSIWQLQVPSFQTQLTLCGFALGSHIPVGGLVILNCSSVLMWSPVMDWHPIYGVHPQYHVCISHPVFPV